MACWFEIMKVSLYHNMKLLSPRSLEVASSAGPRLRLYRGTVVFYGVYRPAGILSRVGRIRFLADLCLGLRRPVPILAASPLFRRGFMPKACEGRAIVGLDICGRAFDVIGPRACLSGEKRWAVQPFVSPIDVFRLRAAPFLKALCRVRALGREMRK